MKLFTRLKKVSLVIVTCFTPFSNFAYAQNNDAPYLMLYDHTTACLGRFMTMQTLVERGSLLSVDEKFFNIYGTIRKKVNRYNGLGKNAGEQLNFSEQRFQQKTVENLKDTFDKYNGLLSAKNYEGLYYTWRYDMSVCDIRLQKVLALFDY